MRLRGDGKLGLIILAAGLAPAIIKKSKPLANYLSDQLARASEYLRVEDKPENAEGAPTPETSETDAKVEEAVADPVEPVAAAKPKRKTPTPTKPAGTSATKAAAKPKPKPTKSQS